MANVTMADLELLTWRQSVERFVEDSPWLTPAHLPQLKALYQIAVLLDSGKAQAALISQFTLTQRTLAAKGAEPATPDPSMPPMLPGMEGALGAERVGSDY